MSADASKDEDLPMDDEEEKSSKNIQLINEQITRYLKIIQ